MTRLAICLGGEPPCTAVLPACLPHRWAWVLTSGPSSLSSRWQPRRPVGTELGVHHTWPAKRKHSLPCLLLQASLRGLNPISTSYKNVHFIANLFLCWYAASADLCVANKHLCAVSPHHCVTALLSLWEPGPAGLLAGAGGTRGGSAPRPSPGAGRRTAGVRHWLQAEGRGVARFWRRTLLAASGGAGLG